MMLGSVGFWAASIRLVKVTAPTVNTPLQRKDFKMRNTPIYTEYENARQIKWLQYLTIVESNKNDHDIQTDPSGVLCPSSKFTKCFAICS